MRIAVIGADVVGTSIARRLQQRGADTICIPESDTSVQAQHPSVIFSPFSQLLRSSSSGLLTWQRQLQAQLHLLERELVDPGIHWSGALFVEKEGEPHFSRRAHYAREQGIGIEFVDAARSKELEPTLQTPPDGVLLWEEAAGWLDAERLVGALLTSFRAAGGLKANSPLAGFEGDAAHVSAIRLRDGSVIEVDAVVQVARLTMAGVGGAPQPSGSELRFASSVELNGPSKPRRVIQGPSWSVRPEPSGRVTVEGDGSWHASAPPPHAIAQALPALDRPQARSPLQRLPGTLAAIGPSTRVDNLYIAQGPSIVWGPVLALIVATEVLERTPLPELNDVRPRV